jgi:uncharacterized protein (DUF305 family)
MKHQTSVTINALAVASALALTGCASGTPQSSTSPPATSSAAPSTTTATTADVSPEHASNDVLFAQMMIPHHQQAVKMSQTLLGKDGIPQDVRELAERIVAAQGPEIDRMNQMLQTWDQPAVTDSSGMGMDHGMMSDGAGNGMMSDEQMGQLEDAAGPDATRIYLEQMIRHHRGAIVMAQNEVGNGQNPEAITLAKAIIEAQNAEIEEMEGLLVQDGLPSER